MNGLQVTTTSITLAPSGSTSFTACTQYATTYKITVSPSGILKAPVSGSSVTPAVQPTTIKSATITVTAGATCGSATITVKDKKGNTATVGVRVLCSQTFSYTGSGQSFVVPSGVTQITVDAVGASGGLGNFPPQGDQIPGLGEEVTATLSGLTSGETLYVYVGGAGGPGIDLVPYPGFNGGGPAFYSGGGGGGSDVRTTNTQDTAGLNSRLIVAGGGGGAGGGDVGNPPGGNAGFANGASGGFAEFMDMAGGGGGQNPPGGAGGTVPAGVSAGLPGANGQLGAGGGYATFGGHPDGGGGGGGYYGGGSGAGGEDSTENFVGGGGGGGSSFVESGATNVASKQATTTQCDANNNGCITISW